MRKGRAGQNDKPEAGEMVRVAVRVPADLADAFERVAASQERTISGEIRRLMRLRVAESDEIAA
jgi:hypothetical protein